MKSIITALALAALASSGTAQAADNMTFGGSLRAHACTLHPDDGQIAIDFGEVGNRDLYLSGSTPDVPFHLRLLNCNTQVAQNVEVTFSGAANGKIPGALALDGGSTAKGIAILLKDASLQPLPLGTAYTGRLSQGETTLTFNRSLQVEPDALANNGIVPGSFTASGTFSLLYP